MPIWKQVIVVLAGFVLGLSFWISQRSANCQNSGGHLELPSLRCRPAIPILLERDLKRSDGTGVQDRRFN